MSLGARVDKLRQSLALIATLAEGSRTSIARLACHHHVWLFVFSAMSLKLKHDQLDVLVLQVGTAETAACDLGS